MAQASKGMGTYAVKLSEGNWLIIRPSVAGKKAKAERKPTERMQLVWLAKR